MDGKGDRAYTMKNYEGYHDPTAGKAVSRAARHEGRTQGSKTRPLTYRIGALTGYGEVCKKALSV